MWDKFDIEVPFDHQHVNLLSSSTEEALAGCVDCRDYDMPLMGQVTMVDGQPVVGSIKSQKWDTISSGLAGLAVGFYPEGNGFNRWPHIRMKASPAKILQGHNVFGPEDPKQGILQMFAYLQIALPKIYSHLDVERSRICYTDATYSCRVPDHFSIRLIKSFESLATARCRINGKWADQGYIQLGYGSEYQRQKVYKKDYEIMADLKDAKRTRHTDRIAALSDPRLADWTRELHRFEATTGPRKFEALGVPIRLPDFIRYCDWFEEAHGEPLCRWLWHLGFDPLLGQFEGRTMKRVNDSEIKLILEGKYFRVSEEGKVCRRLANAIYKTYELIRLKGYESLQRERNATFRRNVKLMVDAGISLAFLKSLDPHTNDNVISMINVVSVDFSKQRPDWYVEPQAGFSQPGRHLRLVG